MGQVLVQGAPPLLIHFRHGQLLPNVFGAIDILGTFGNFPLDALPLFGVTASTIGSGAFSTRLKVVVTLVDHGVVRIVIFSDGLVD